MEPYRDTVLRLFQAGKSHREIHARIGQAGFTGSANAVYHYLTQYAREHAIPYGRRQPIVPHESQADAVPPRPEPIAMERVSTTTIYRRLLHLAASSRESASSDNPEPSERPPVPESTAAPAPEPWGNHTQYADSIAKIVDDTEPKASTSAKTPLTATMWAHLLQLAPELGAFLTCLIAFYDVLMAGDVARLDRFIATYLNDPRESLATFAAGLQKDYTAVKHCLLYPDISNGPMEATNQKIKMTRRRTYGRAGLELLNALLVLPWHYRHQNASSQSQPIDTAA